MVQVRAHVFLLWRVHLGNQLVYSTGHLVSNFAHFKTRPTIDLLTDPNPHSPGANTALRQRPYTNPLILQFAGADTYKSGKPSRRMYRCPVFSAWLAQ